MTLWQIRKRPLTRNIGSVAQGKVKNEMIIEKIVVFESIRARLNVEERLVLFDYELQCFIVIYNTHFDSFLSLQH